MSVYKKLQQARVKLQQTKMNKSGHNKFAGYKYFELADFLNHIQVIFNEIGLCGVVSFTSDIATLKVIDIDDGSHIEFTSPMGSAALKGCHEVQNIGAVETYQRRYLYVVALEIVEHDAIDSSEPAEPKQAKAKGIISATSGAYDRLSSDNQTACDDAVSYIKQAFIDNREIDAYEVFCTISDPDTKTAVWSFLDSKTRSTLKQLKEQDK